LRIHAAYHEQSISDTKFRRVSALIRDAEHTFIADNMEASGCPFLWLVLSGGRGRQLNDPFKSPVTHVEFGQ